MTTYRERDYVAVVDEDGVDLPPVPKAWLGTSLVPDGVKKADGQRRQASPSVAGELAEAQKAQADAEAATAAAVKDAESARAELAKFKADAEAAAAVAAAAPAKK